MLPNLGRLSLQQADTRVVFTYDDTEKWDKAYKQKFQENECPVCFEKFKRGDEIVVLECGHTFCGECFRQWDQNKRNCPLCRKRVEDDELLTPEGLFIKAARDGNLSKVTQMLEDGIDVNAHYENGNTALMWACVNEHTHVALALLEDDDIKVDLANDYGNTALHQASDKGMLAVVKKLIAKDANVNKQNEDGNTALIVACKYKQPDVALVLLESKDIKVDLKDEDGDTALHYASHQKMTEVVKKLIVKDADVNKQDKNGITALIWACYAKNTDIALALLESKNIEVDLVDNNGETALHPASRQGMLAVIEKLITKGTDVNKQNRNGYTALMHACDNEHTHVALALLNVDGIEVDLVNVVGETALHRASSKGMLSVVEKLIEKRADVNKQDKRGNTALIGACEHKNTDVALALLERTGIEVDLANNNGETALHQASEKGMLAVVKRLIEKDADVNKQNDYGNTALMKACIVNHAYVALALLEHPDIRVDLVTNSGYTALHQASEKGMLAVVEKLIEKRADVNKQTEYGDTALIIACEYKHADVAFALLERTGIEVDLVNNDGETALHQAFNNDMTEVVERIREIQSRRASDDATPMEVDVVSPDDRRDKSGEGRSVRQRIRATAAARLRVRLQKLV